MSDNNGSFARGSNHPRWTNERIVTPEGYVKIRVGKSHPLADVYGYAYEHRVVWVSAGNSLDPDMPVHHISGDKLDNRIENLRKTTKSDHSKMHSVNQKRNKKGQFVAEGI